ncbi:unnamed protein product [Jaminaea pallidilutea]
MPPKDGSGGVQASNIIEGSRKRGRHENDGIPSPSAGATAVPADPPSSQTQAAASPEDATRLGYKLLNVIYHARDVADEDDPEALLVDPFLELPDREVYADYYQVIRRPLTFEDIRRKLDERGYTTLDEAKHDCEVVCQNAKRYNQKDTIIWLKARALHSIVKDTYADLVMAKGDVKSTQLDSRVPLIDEGPEGVEPITSQPPSPVKRGVHSNSRPSKGESPPVPSASSPPSSALMAGSSANRGTKITLKRKPSGNPEVREAGPSAAASGSGSPATNMPSTPIEDDDDDDLDADGEIGPDGKRRRPGGRGRKLKSQMKGWVVDLTQLRKPDGSLASEFFQELPSRGDYPDYYKIITAPISLKEIASKVHSRDYASPFAFISDVRVMLANAKYYNEQGSLVWNDADTIEKHVERRLIPGMLKEGFTMDPNDHRASVLPPYMQDGSNSPQRSVTPQNVHHRVKIKLGQRGPNGVSAGSPGPTNSPGSVPMPRPTAPTPQSVMQPSVAPYPTPQMAASPQNTMASSGPTATPTATAFSASGRPMRSAARSMGSPQALTSPAPNQPRPSPQLMGQPQLGQAVSPAAQFPGMARSNAGSSGYFGAQQHPQGAVQTPSQHPASAGMSPQMPRQPMPYRHPGLAQDHQQHQPHPGYQIQQQQQPRPLPRPMPHSFLRGAAPPSAFASPKAGGKTRTAAVPAFVLLSAKPLPVQKMLPVMDVRQFAWSVSQGCDECRVMFYVRDFGSLPSQPAAGNDAMEVDPSSKPEAEEGKQGQARSADESVKPSDKGESLRQPLWQPSVAVTLNGRSQAVKWLSGPEEVETDKRQRSRRAKINGSAAAKDAADGEEQKIDEGEEDDGDDKDEVSSRKGPIEPWVRVPAARPRRNDANDANDANDGHERADLALPLASIVLSPLQRGTNILDVTFSYPPPCSPLEQIVGDENREQADRLKARQALAVPEMYRIWITR